MTEKASEAELATYRQAAKLSGSMVEIEFEINSMETTAKSKLFSMIRDGKLTPDTAMNFCMEMFAYSRLRLRLKEKAAFADQYRETKTLGE